MTIHRKLSALFVALWMSALSVFTPFGAEAASIERLPDGRVVLIVLGERLAFREQDADRVGLQWPSDVCRSKHPMGLMLRRWLDDPDLAACLKTAIPDSFVERSSVTFIVYFGYQDGNSYPGAGRRIDQPLAASSSLYPGHLEVSELPAPPLLLGAFFVTVRDPAIATECAADFEGASDELGYRRLTIGKSPPISRFMRSSDRRPQFATAPSRPACLACTAISTWKCSIEMSSQDGRVAVSIDWLEPSFRGPKSSWDLYDTATRKIAHSIFVDRSAGDIQ